MKLCYIFWPVKSNANKIYQPLSEANYTAIDKTALAH